MKPVRSLLQGAFVMTLVTGCQATPDDTVSRTVYFRVAGATDADTFVIALNNPATIAEARAIASGEEQSKVHVTGLVVNGAVPYNAPWSFHLHPASISFFEVSTEVCDAATSYVEEHLDEVGGAFLPGRRWCPWSSRVIEEIEP